MDLVIEGLQEAYDAEQQLLEALPKMSKAAFTEKFQDAFSLHTEQTRSRLNRVENLLNKLHSKPVGDPPDGIKGIIVEAERLLAEAPKADPAVYQRRRYGNSQKTH